MKKTTKRLLEERRMWYIFINYNAEEQVYYGAIFNCFQIQLHYLKSKDYWALRKSLIKHCAMYGQDYTVYNDNIPDGVLDAEVCADSR